MGGRPTHGEEGEAGQFKHLPPHQVEHVGPDGLHPASVPGLYRISGQGIIVFMVPGDEGQCEGQPLQPVQGLIIPFIPEPHTAEVPQLEHHILLGEPLALREVFRAEPLKIPVCVARRKNLHAVIHLLFG